MIMLLLLGLTDSDKEWWFDFFFFLYLSILKGPCHILMWVVEKVQFVNVKLVYICIFFDFGLAYLCSSPIF